MTRRLVVTLEAGADIAEAIAWFGRISPSLPARLRVELDDVNASILEHPELHPVVYRNFRRALLRKFPYSVFYVVDGDVVLVVGVVHQSRDESAWKRRI